MPITAAGIEHTRPAGQRRHLSEDSVMNGRTAIPCRTGTLVTVLGVTQRVHSEPANEPRLDPLGLAGQVVASPIALSLKAGIREALWLEPMGWKVTVTPLQR